MSMTERDFEIVEGWLREAMEFGEERHNEPYEKAIHALEEIQQYRAIGTVSEFREAMFFKKYFMELYGEGLEVANWHLNGDLELLDNFIDEAVECGKQEESGEHDE